MSQAQSMIPNLLRVGEIPANMAMNVETSIVEPVVQTESFIRFQMNRSGFLHSNSKLLLSLDGASFTDYRDRAAAAGNKAAGVKGAAFYPANIGISNLISRVRLLSGNTVIQEIDDWNFLEAYKAMFVANENNKEKAQYTESKLINFAFAYSDQDLTVGTAQRSDVRSIGIGLDNGTCYDGSYNIVDGADDDYDMYARRCQSIENNPVYQISLSSLVPFLKSTQLPLFMFDEQIFLEITLVSATDRAVGNARQMSGSDANKALSFKMNQNETRLIVDYISYPEDTMNAWANANKNMSFTYFDYELSKFTVSKSTANSGFIRNCGGAGKLVTKMICGLSQDMEDVDSNSAILGDFAFVHPNRDTAQSVERVETNLRYNDRYLYPITVKNDSYHFSNTLAAEAVPPFVTRDMYACQGESTVQRKYNGVLQDAVKAGTGTKFNFGLVGSFFWQAFKLNRNERINQKGIELYQKYIDIEDTAHTLRIWLEVMKVGSLVDGKLRAAYA
jgi:hypothetical protein